MKKNEQIKLTEEIIETAYKLLIHKIAHGGLVTNNEAAFQLEFGYILKSLGELYEFKLEDKFHLEFETYLDLNEKSRKSKSDRARVDLLVRYGDGQSTATAIIELKYFKRENHREPNNRYDAFQDISNLEMYKRHNIDLCYFILATDHHHYVNQENYSLDTGDFDLRHGKEYKSGKVLSYRTEKPHGIDITLTGNYNFKWDSVNNYHFLKLKI